MAIRGGVMITAENLTDEQVRQWEKSEVARLASPGLRSKVGAIAAAALGQAVGVELTNGNPSDVRRSARDRIAAAINARANR